MLNNHKHEVRESESSDSYKVSTLLNAQTPVPLDCDNCGQEQIYSISALRKLPTLKCSACDDTRNFSAYELEVLEGALKKMGFYITK